VCGVYNILEKWGHICAASVSFFTRRYSSASPKGMNWGEGGGEMHILAYTSICIGVYPIP